MNNKNSRRNAVILPDFLLLTKTRNSTNYFSIQIFNFLPNSLINLHVIPFKGNIKKLLITNPLYNLEDIYNLHKNDYYCSQYMSISHHVKIVLFLKMPNDVFASSIMPFHLI